LVVYHGYKKQYQIIEQKTSSDDSQNPSSPKYLYLGENLEIVLINIQLDGGNYHAWSWGMKRALLSKNKHKFVDGSIPVPQFSSSLHEFWKSCNMMIISWITKTLN